MAGIIFGLLLGLLVGGLIFTIGGAICDNSSLDSKPTEIVGIIIMVIGAILVVASPFIGFNIDKGDETAYIEQYKIQKEAIESSINNDKLTGFERAELVKQANELNSELAKKKHDVNKWYGFVIDDRVQELNYVKLK